MGTYHNLVDSGFQEAIGLPNSEGETMLSETQAAQLNQLFYSYSHKDERLRDILDVHLSLLQRQDLIAGWHDRKIGAGQEWAGQINEHLEAARVILLLISADFIASSYCYDVELTRAMERHESGHARVIPVILRPCDWHSAPFARLQALPTDGKAITSWSNRDEAFLNVTQGIRKVLSQMSLRP